MKIERHHVWKVLIGVAAVFLLWVLVGFLFPIKIDDPYVVNVRLRKMKPHPIASIFMQISQDEPTLKAQLSNLQDWKKAHSMGNNVSLSVPYTCWKNRITGSISHENYPRMAALRINYRDGTMFQQNIELPPHDGELDLNLDLP